jgi:hypothetical protein
VLKEEIRRHERNDKRAEYAANLEYLKNVLLKFIEAVEEREQLIPVLGMLLHFSKDEQARALHTYRSGAAATAGAVTAAGETHKDTWWSKLI